MIDFHPDISACFHLQSVDQKADQEGFWILDYEGDKVDGTVYTGVKDGVRVLVICEWNSRDPGLGNADRALRALRPHFDLIVAQGIGEIDDEGPDISVVYWQRQHEKGLVDQLVLDDGKTLDMGGPGKLILVRGHQGSGKSTMAAQIAAENPGTRHLEQDQFLARDGNYAYDPERHAHAKYWCLRAASIAIACGHDVVVANTFTTLADLNPYLAIPSSGMRVVEMFHDFPNTHAVPDEIVNAKKAQFQPYLGATQVGKKPSMRPC